MNPVSIPSPDLLAFDVLILFKVGDDPLHRPLGDPDLLRDLAKPKVRGLGKQEQDVGVVAEERPARPRGSPLAVARRVSGVGQPTGLPMTGRTEPQVQIRPEWALLDSNQRPSPCNGDALAN
jgi:hypothetical protein